jgi:Domain of Unknown Function (DUF748)
MPASKKRKLVIVLSIVVGLLVIVRLILPYVVLHYANKTLANMKGYYGHIKTIDLALIRGAYKIDSIYLNKLDSNTKKQTPFFSATLIDLSIEWKALFHGKINGELTFKNPVLKFTKDKVEPKTLRKDSSSFKDLLNGFMPLDINKFEIDNGKIEYADEGSKPKVDIAMTRVSVVAKNLKNSYASTDLLPATVFASADVYQGTLTFNMKINPLAKDPTFDLNAQLRDTNLPDLNEFFDAYASVKISKGTFGLFTEVAAKGGNFKGYVKPVISHMKVMGAATKHDKILKKIWEGFVGTVADVLTNHKKHQFATKIPFEGSLKEPNTNIWYAVSHILQNAFIRALVPNIDDDINITSVDAPKEKKKTLLQKVFGKGDKKADDKKADDKKPDEKKPDEKKN